MRLKEKQDIVNDHGRGMSKQELIEKYKRDPLELHFGFAAARPRNHLVIQKMLPKIIPAEPHSEGPRFIKCQSRGVCEILHTTRTDWDCTECLELGPHNCNRELLSCRF
ncbi:hypothetical protein Ciccas_001144 [Cichlidogyrus casuarinus]|uniref:Uncharacterized protein n=1 Tax=Cichlidogyrus casuarinus TaxID=1844966 RepID=A0ABD2QKX1_9PLAT